MGVHDNMYIHVRTDGRGGRVRRRQRIPYNVMTTAGTVATWKEASVSALLARGPGCTAAANGSITHNAVAVATGAAEAEARRGAGRSIIIPHATNDAVRSAATVPHPARR